MIIQTRYRDIDFGEVQRVHRMMKPAGDSGERWAKRRGKPIQIQTPDDGRSECGAPNYTVLNDPAGEGAYACVHIAEIGD